MQTIMETHNKTNSICPFGVLIAQKWPQVAAIFEALDDFDITLLIELGAYKGGFSELMFLRSQRVPSFQYFGVQLDIAEIEPRLLGVLPIYHGDVFSEEIQGIVNSFIWRNASGKSMVFCDNGNKPEEMRTYAKIVRVGDYILAHDYPAETTEESLKDFYRKFLYMEEVDPAFYRGIGVTLWRKIQDERAAPREN